jgi:hypothetical protein
VATKILKPTKEATFFAAPFGPYNQFLFNDSGLYVESGALSLQYSGYANINSYFPEQLYTNIETCPITGYLFVNSSRVNSSDGCQEDKVVSVSGTNTAKGVKGFLESIAFGCEKKVDEVECMNPNGNSYTLYRHEIAPKTIIDFPILPIVPSAGGQMAVGQAYLEWRNNWLKSQMTQSYIKGYSFNSSPFALKSEKADICDCDLIDRKYNLKRYVHPQSFSGKTRLFVQSIFGSKEKLMDVEINGITVSVMYHGLAKNTDDTKRKRIASLDKQFTKLHTDDAGNYYLLQVSSSISINALVPSREGRLLQKWLKTKNFDKKKSSVYEAFILSSCSPTKTVNIAGSSLEGVCYQSLGGYGWKSNWRGNEFSIATLDWETPCKAKLFTANVTLTDPVVLYSDEKDRKLASIVEQYEAPEILKKLTKEEREALVPAVVSQYKSIYSLLVTEIPGENPEDPPIKKYCIDGDIHEGEWGWVISNEFNVTPSTKKNLEDELKTKNKQDGGLPYSPTFFKDLADAFIVSESLADSGEFKFPYYADRIFTWDEMYGVFNLELPYDVRDHIGGMAGSGPVYCFYNDKDLLKIVYYQNGAVTPTSTNDNDNSENQCGDAFTRGSTINGGGGGSSSFYIGGIEVLNLAASSYSQSESSSKQSCGGSNLECLEYPPHPGPCNIVYCGTYFWKNFRGSVQGSSFSFSGGQSSKICLVISKYDCETVFMASVTSYSGSHSESQTDGKNCICAQWVSPRRSAAYWQPCFSPLENCTAQGGEAPCCAKEKQYGPKFDQNYGPGQACADIGPTMGVNGAIFIFDVYGFWFNGPNSDAVRAGDNNPDPNRNNFDWSNYSHVDQNAIGWRPSKKGNIPSRGGYCTYRPTTPDCAGEELKFIPQGIQFAYLGSGAAYDSDCNINYSSKSKSMTSSVLKVYAVTRTDETLVLEGTEGYGDLGNMFAGDISAGNAVFTPGCHEWTGEQKFLGRIDPMFPYVESVVTINQSVNGVYWLVSPDMIYSADYPFDKKGLYYIGSA